MCDLVVVTDRPLPTQAALAQTLAAEIRAEFRRLKLRLREHGGKDDLTPSQIAVLLRLENNGAATVSSLARAEGMRPQSMSAIVAPLQVSGLLRGAPDPGDGRQTLLSLTSRCRKRLEKSRAARQDWLASTITEKLTLREQQQLHAALTLLARIAAP